MLSMHLKVPKCEIFDCSDFLDFYTIKPFWVDDAIRNCRHMLRVRISSGHICSDNASVPDAHAQDIYQFLMCMLKFHMCIQ
jgi:hypothetical protein